MAVSEDPEPAISEAPEAGKVRGAEMTVKAAFGIGGLALMATGGGILAGWGGGCLALGFGMIMVWHGRTSPIPNET